MQQFPGLQSTISELQNGLGMIAEQAGAEGHSDIHDGIQFVSDQLGGEVASVQSELGI